LSVDLPLVTLQLPFALSEVVGLPLLGVVVAGLVFVCACANCFGASHPAAKSIVSPIVVAIPMIASSEPSAGTAPALIQRPSRVRVPWLLGWMLVVYRELNPRLSSALGD